MRQNIHASSSFPPTRQNLARIGLPPQAVPTSAGLQQPRQPQQQLSRGAHAHAQALAPPTSHVQPPQQQLLLQQQQQHHQQLQAWQGGPPGGGRAGDGGGGGGGGDGGSGVGGGDGQVWRSLKGVREALQRFLPLSTCPDQSMVSGTPITNQDQFFQTSAEALIHGTSVNDLDLESKNLDRIPYFQTSITHNDQ
eukprot:1160249-Pelagomonas_calceolata.AAC.7